MKYFVYILKSMNDEKTYIGMTNDIERRLKEHNSGKNIYTKKYTPWEVIYKEVVADRASARKREKYFKSAAGRRKLKILLNN
ncbi:MAG: GIY-YIG nuclease family protein [bacterium]|nr:GIY-YIG nuclease family protein [bacterium]